MSDNALCKRVGKYELSRTLGSGTFSKVKQAVNLETGEIFAIKIIKRSELNKEGMEEQLRREIAVQKAMTHKHVVKLVEVMKTARHIYVVLELITGAYLFGGELFDKIVAAKRFDEVTARKYFQQLIYGLEYCHSQGIAHRDLKPENLLVAGDGTLKISDFGFARIVESGAGNVDVMKTVCGTPHYVAPEVLQGKGYDGMLADLWSCGVILYVMIAGAHPFDAPSMSALFKKIEKGAYTFPAAFPAGPKQLVQRMLDLDPRGRPTLAEIKRDPWFKVAMPQEMLSLNSRIVVSEADMQSSITETVETQEMFKRIQDAVRSGHDGASGACPSADLVESGKGKAAAASGPSRPKVTILTGPEEMNGFDLLSHMMTGLLSPLARKVINHDLSTQVNRPVKMMANGKALTIFDYVLGTATKLWSYSGAVKTRPQELRITASGKRCGISIQVRPTVINTSVIDLSRSSGDSLEFHELCNAFAEEFCTAHPSVSKGIMNLASSDRE